MEAGWTEEGALPDPADLLLNFAGLSLNGEADRSRPAEVGSSWPDQATVVVDSATHELEPLQQQLNQSLDRASDGTQPTRGPLKAEDSADTGATTSFAGLTKHLHSEEQSSVVLKGPSSSHPAGTHMPPQDQPQVGYVYDAVMERHATAEGKVNWKAMSGFLKV